jgi:hypothetical protein
MVGFCDGINKPQTSNFFISSMIIDYSRKKLHNGVSSHISKSVFHYHQFKNHSEPPPLYEI